MAENEEGKGNIEPNWSNKFNSVEVTEEIKKINKKYFDEKDYNPEEGFNMCAELSKKVRDELLKKRLPRYKLICQVFIGQKKDQKLSIVAKGYWDNYVDNYAIYTYETDTFYCTNIVYGFYTD